MVDDNDTDDDFGSIDSDQEFDDASTVESENEEANDTGKNYHFMVWKSRSKKTDVKNSLLRRATNVDSDNDSDKDQSDLSVILKDLKLSEYHFNAHFFNIRITGIIYRYYGAPQNGFLNAYKIQQDEGMNKYFVKFSVFWYIYRLLETKNEYFKNRQKSFWVSDYTDKYVTNHFDPVFLNRVAPKLLVVNLIIFHFWLIIWYH